MADVKVNFVHPTHGGTLTVTLDDTMTASEVVGELLASEFMEPNPQGYDIAIKGGDMINGQQTLVDAGVKDGTIVRVIPATDAGSEMDQATSEV